MSITGSWFPEVGKCPGKPPIASPDWPSGSMYRFYEVTLKQRRHLGVMKRFIQINFYYYYYYHYYPTSVDEGTTVKWPALLLHTGHYTSGHFWPLHMQATWDFWKSDAWYRSHICTVRLPTVFWYIEGTTPKIDIFQFLFMASRAI